MPGAELVYALRQVTTTGGSSLPVSALGAPSHFGLPHPDLDYLSAKGTGYIGATVKLAAPPGDYTLTFTVDVAVLGEKTAPMVVGDLPGQAIHWPKARAMWTDVVTVPLTIVPAEP